MGCQPLSALFCILHFYFLSTPSLSFQKFQNWWIIHLRVSNSISKISIAYVFYNPPQSDTIINHQSQTPRLDWSSLLRLGFVITCSPTSLLVIPSSRRLPLSKSRFAPLPPLARSNSSSRSGSSVPRPWTLSLTHTLCFLLSTIPSVILCSHTPSAALFCSGYACICWRTNKNS